MKHNNKGFTLAELLIVVAVIAVLVAVAIPTFSNQLEKSRQAVDVSNLRGAYAAARLAEMDGSVNNVPFKTYERYLRVGADDETARTGTDKDKLYASFWYDPDSGKLIAITNKDTGDPSAVSGATYHTQEKDEASNAAFKLFSLSSQKGKATGTRVLVNTTQLPGEGEKIVVYQDAQMERYEGKSGGTYATTDFHTGTIDKAIRVTFYHTQSDKFKLHEISFVMFENSPLYNEGTEDEVIVKATNTDVTAGADKTFEYALSNVTIGDMPYDSVKDLYTIIIVPDKASNYEGDVAESNGKIEGKHTTDVTTTTKGKIKVTFRSKQDITMEGTFTISVAANA